MPEEQVLLLCGFREVRHNFGNERKPKNHIVILENPMCHKMAILLPDLKGNLYFLPKDCRGGGHCAKGFA